MSLLLAVAILQARVPGVTVMVWETGKRFATLPKLVQGQAPNAFYVVPQLGLADRVRGNYGVFARHFVGEVSAKLKVDEAGTYGFRLEADDGARLTIFGELVCDTEDSAFRAGPSAAEGQYKLATGSCDLRIRFFQNDGPFFVRLRWRRPGATVFEPIPSDRLTSEAGLTFVTSPGHKRAELGAPKTRPGDGRPLDDVHPSFTLENLRGPEFRPAVGGLAFLPDGRLALCTWDEQGAVYLIEGLTGRSTRITRFAKGLGEPLGVAWFRGDLYVTQKGEVTRIRDTDADGEADQYFCLSAGWPVSQNYHEFTFNLVPFQGSLYVTTSVPLRGGHTNYMPGSHGAFAVSGGPGSWIRIDAETGAWERLANGLRTPNGMNIGVDGRMFVADNQGTWLPSSALYVLRPGASYLHRERPEESVSPQNLAVWFPHGEIGNSPSEMVLVPDGPYRGQMLIGDVTYGGLQRVFLEKVAGQYQGAVFKHSQGLEAGVNRLAWGPDGCLYIGCIGSNGNWNHLGHKFGLQRLRPNGRLPFEVLELSARRNGFVVQFTKPLGPDAQARLRSALVRQWRYVPSMGYGGPKVADRPVQVERVRCDQRRGLAFLQLSGLREGGVVYFNFRGLAASDGSPMWSPEAWYTLNRAVPTPFDSFEPARGALFVRPPARSEALIGPGARTRLVRKADGGTCDWRIAGESLEVVHDPTQAIGGNDMVSPAPHADVLVHVEWLSPPGGDPARQLNGNSGIKLQERYEVQVLNQPGIVDRSSPATLFNEAGSIYRQTAPSRNPSYGAGVWQTYDIWFTAPKWNGTAKLANARMTVFWNGVLVHDNVEVKRQTGVSAVEAPGGRLLLQDHENGAEGGVRFRNVWWVKDPVKHGIIPPKRT